MRFLFSFPLSLCLIAGILFSPASAESRLNRPPAEGEVDYAPADGAVVAVNPPAFVWLPVESVGEFVLQYSQRSDFSDPGTTTIEGLDLTVHVPGEVFSLGRWYWRFGYAGEGADLLFSETRSFTIPPDAVVFPLPSRLDVLARIPQERPRVYFSPELVQEIRRDADGKYAGIVASVVREAEAVIQREEELFQEPRPWDEYEDPRRAYFDTFIAMRPYTRGMEVCARAYVYTGDRRFAEEARRRLMHFMTWDVDGPSSVYPPTELGMDIADHAPRTFDWIYDVLTDEEREICVEVLARRLAQINDVHRSRPFESQPFSSHPGRMIGFAVEGGLVLAHEVPEAADSLFYTLRLLWSVYPAWGGAAGGWHEGLGYWGGYMRRITQVVVELDRLGIPLKEKPFFRNTGWFGLYAGHPSRGRRSFGDGYERPVGRGFGNLLYSLSSLYENPHFRWYAEEVRGGPDGPAAMAVFRPDLKAESPADLPQSRLFDDVGWVAMHSNMAEPDDNITLVMQSSTFGSISHNHAAQNAFVIDAFGQPLAISSGYYHLYGSPHHREWVWQTRAHNSILVDGEGQETRSRAARGRIIAYEEKGDYCYAAADATEAYGGRLNRFLRHIVFLRPNTFVIIDDLESAVESSTFQWLLHAQKEMALDQANQRVTIGHGDARLRAHFLQPAKLSFEQKTGWDPLPDRPADGPEQFHFTASTSEPTGQMRFVSVLSVYREGEEADLPEIRLLSVEGGIGVAVGEQRVLWKDPAAKAVRFEGFETENPVTVGLH